MKKFALSIVILLTFFSMSLFADDAVIDSNSQREPANNKEVKYGELLIAAEGLNLRKGPTMNSEIVRKAKKDEVLFRMSNHHENGYIRVKLENGDEVWAHKDYTKPLTTEDNPYANNNGALVNIAAVAVTSGALKARRMAFCAEQVDETTGRNTIVNPKECMTEVKSQQAMVAGVRELADYKAELLLFIKAHNL